MRSFPPQLRRSAALVAVALSLASVLACGGDGGTNPNSDAIEGTYSLKTVGGSFLPLTAQTGTSSFTLEKDVITIAHDGSWTEAINYTETSAGQTTTGTDTDGGTWTRTGSSISLYSTVYASTAYAGTYDNGRLTFNSLGFVLVFVRQ